MTTVFPCLSSTSPVPLVGNEGIKLLQIQVGQLAVTIFVMESFVYALPNVTRKCRMKRHIIQCNSGTCGIMDALGQTKGLTFHDGQCANDWWSDNRNEVPELLSWMAVFLLGAPVQGADCKRTFKDVATHHTKTKNCMHVATAFDNTAITHDL